jgi:hypothetical protein
MKNACIPSALKKTVPSQETLTNRSQDCFTATLFRDKQK